MLFPIYVQINFLIQKSLSAMQININNPIIQSNPISFESHEMRLQRKMNILIKKILHQNRKKIKDANVIPYIKSDQIVFLK